MVGYLQEAIDGVESDGGPGSEGQGLVVLVVQAVDVLVQKLVLVQRAVHPVNAHLHEEQIEAQVGEVVGPAADLVDVEVHLRHVVLNKILREHRQARVHEERCLSEAHLIQESVPGGQGAALTGEQLVRHDVVDHEVPNTSGNPVNASASHQIAEVALRVVTVFMPKLRQQPRRNIGQAEDGEHKVVNQLVGGSVRVKGALSLQSNVLCHITEPKR